jgi:ferric-dicitrate binding protein FerR (iron transport regulator)
LALPTWGANEVVGIAVRSQSATVHQAKLTTGSTVYSGDAITAAPNGRAQISLPGGGRVDVLSNSTVRVERNAQGVELMVERGSASFQTRPDSPVSALFTDARVRAATKSGSALGVVGMESPDSVLVVAKIGTLEVMSEHDSRSVLVPEGSAARISLLPEEPAQGPAGVPAAGRSRRRLAVILLLVGGGVTAGAILAATAGSDDPAPVSPSTP